VPAGEGTLDAEQGEPIGSARILSGINRLSGISACETARMN